MQYIAGGNGGAGNNTTRGAGVASRRFKKHVEHILCDNRTERAEMSWRRAQFGERHAGPCPWFCPEWQRKARPKSSTLPRRSRARSILPRANLRPSSRLWRALVVAGKVIPGSELDTHGLTTQNLENKWEVTRIAKREHLCMKNPRKTLVSNHC